MSQNYDELDDEAVLEVLGNSQTISKETDVTILDEPVMPELQIEVKQSVMRTLVSGLKTSYL